MKLGALLNAKKSLILDAWLDRLLASYPPDTAKFFKSKRDDFANPIGTTMREGLQRLLEGLIAGRDPASEAEILEQMVKIQSVQDFGPADGLRFLFELKILVRERVAADDGEAQHELPALERAIDELALAAFEIYTRCREQVCELRINDVKRSTSGLVRLLNERGYLEVDEAGCAEASEGVCAAHLQRGKDS